MGEQLISFSRLVTVGRERCMRQYVGTSSLYPSNHRMTLIVLIARYWNNPSVSRKGIFPMCFPAIRSSWSSLTVRPFVWPAYRKSYKTAELNNGIQTRPSSFPTYFPYLFVSLFPLFGLLSPTLTSAATFTRIAFGDN